MQSAINRWFSYKYTVMLVIVLQALLFDCKCSCSTFSIVVCFLNKLLQVCQYSCKSASLACLQYHLPLRQSLLRDRLAGVSDLKDMVYTRTNPQLYFPDRILICYCVFSLVLLDIESVDHFSSQNRFTITYGMFFVPIIWVSRRNKASIAWFWGSQEEVSRSLPLNTKRWMWKLPLPFVMVNLSFNTSFSERTVDWIP